MLFSPLAVVLALLGSFALLTQAQEAQCEGGGFCPAGYRCCHYNSCCNENYYYTSWWFWLIWVVLIFVSTCCYYYRRRRLNNYVARRHANRSIVRTRDDDADVESQSSDVRLTERTANSVVPHSPEEAEFFKDLPPEYAAAVGLPPSYGVACTEQEEPPPEYTEDVQ